MNSEAISKLVASKLDAYRFEVPARSSTLGTPWSAEKISASVEKLRSCLVKPYLHEFALMDTYEQITSVQEQLASYWVIAEAQAYCQFYDPEGDEFGLAEPPNAGENSRTVGVRGDLIGVFCAM
jgi:hypothetical protein